MNFDWDANKNKLNVKNHKISFEEAQTIFTEYTLTYVDTGF